LRYPPPKLKRSILALKDMGETMKKITALITAIALGVALSVGGASVANASPATTLTYEQFTASASYADMQAAVDANTTYLQSRNNMVLTMQTTEVIMGQTVWATVNISANKTAAVASMTMPDPVSGTSATISYGFANGSYFEDTAALMGQQIPNSDQALARMGKTLNSSVNLQTTTPPEGMTPVDPTSLFSGNSVDPTLAVTASTDGLTFSEVSKSDDATKDGATDYSYSIATAPNILFAAMTFDVVYKFDSSGLLYEMAMHGGLQNVLQIDVTATVSSPDTLNIETPRNIFKLSDFTKMTKQISAEKTVTSKANAIAAKAKALAKASKKTLAAKNITDAAKALKYTVSSVKNGVKLTGKYQGVSGSMCVIANKGVATVSHC
jgi:hypothetical protein